MQQMGLETVLEYLLQAPKIVRDVARMNWQIIDAPQDGTVLLVWQPVNSGPRFASDGYIWLDQEAQRRHEARGYVCWGLCS